MTFIVQAVNKRPVMKKHQPQYEEIEKTLFDLGEQTFTERDIHDRTNVDKVIVRQCLHRLKSLGVIQDIGKHSDGNRGRPMRVWSR